MAKRIVVTGASSGIGAATAREFRARGWDVVGVARRTDRLEALAAETGAEVFTADITVQAQVDALAAYLADLGPTHALVNNAGGAFDMASVESADPENWLRMFDINVLGTQRVTAALLPLLRRAIEPGDYATIMTVTSTAGFGAYEGGGGYIAAKYAQHGMVGVLRLELAGEPIRVLEIAPGMVKTEEFAIKRFGGDAERAAKVYENVQDPLSAQDVALTIAEAIELPGHINLDLITIRPVAQAAQFKVIRGELRPKA
jgi:NADP-dependent 3-hydroxy acid dehydrogenase YdfG